MDIKDRIRRAAEVVRITWDGWFSEGKVKYSKSTAIKELINNVLVKSNWVRENGRKVRIQFVFDTKSKLLTITDNFVGFFNPSENLRKAMDLGMSFISPAILREHGRGLKTAVNFWGKLKSIVTTTDGEDFYILHPDYDSDFASFATLKGEPFKWFDYVSKGWIQKNPAHITDVASEMAHMEMSDVANQFITGTQITIDLKSSQIAQQSNWFTNIIKDLEAAYYEYIGETLEVELVWIKPDRTVKTWVANKRELVLSSAVAVEGHTDKKSGFRVKPKSKSDGSDYKYVDDAKKIGPNMWDFDETYNHPSGIVVQYKIGRVPHPKNLEKHFNETKDYLYDPSRYEESPFRYGSKYIGLSYCKKWVPISWGGFKQKRDGQEVFGFINILEGIDTVATKDGIVVTSDVETFEKDFAKHLSKLGVYVRGQADNPKISESVMESRLVKKLRDSKNLREFLGIRETRDFDTQYPLHSGLPDIVPTLNKQVVWGVMELKISQEKMWKAIVQGMAYAMECGHKNVLLVSLFEEGDFPSDIQKKLDIFEREEGWSFRYHQFQKLMEL